MYGRRYDVSLVPQQAEEEKITMPNHKRMLDPKKPLTTGHKAFCKYLIKTKKVKESSLRAGFNENYGSYLLSQPKIQNQIQLLMDKAGLSDQRIVELIKEGSEAMLPVRKSKDGKVLQEAHPDFYNRKDYIKMALQVKGHLKPDFQEGGGGKTININLNINTAQGLFDAGAISEKEYIDLKEISHEPVREEA